MDMIAKSLILFPLLQDLLEVSARSNAIIISTNTPLTQELLHKKKTLYMTTKVLYARSPRLYLVQKMEELKPIPLVLNILWTLTTIIPI